MAFEGVLARSDPSPKRWRRATLTVSLVVHGGLLAAGVAHSLWQVDEMPLPAVEVMLTAQVAPPPPPPPPPAGKKQASEPRRPKTTPTELQQPREVEPTEPVPTAEDHADVESDTETTDEGEPAGVVGGEKGGVPGGVLGGVLGGAAPKPPPKPAGPKMVSGKIGRQQLLINPNVDPYRVKVPRALARSGTEFSAMLRVCVSTAGKVTGVSIIKGAGPPIDSQIPTVIGRWRYRPLTVDGRPTPFCYPLSYRIR